ncbi:hypothetical protein ACS5PK_15305 [Roseateles sp. DB2]|uniref:hypothetical protein n=1 Tax=Roseateles sp. DB2 TaxID=3453717 RepID=UPI003EEA9A95
MITRSTSYIAFVIGVAATAALFTGVRVQVDRTAEFRSQIVKLEPVVIQGKRAVQVAQIQQLPQVVINGRRADSSVS